MVAELFSGLTTLSILLLIAGFVLIGIELKMPGISFPGIAGTLCLAVSVVLTADTVIEGAIMTVAILAVLGVMLGIMLWLLAKGKLIKPIILTEQQTKTEGYISSSDLQYLLGKEGIALTDLRPSGMGSFDGIKIDVISEGQYIVKDTNIIIHQVIGSKIVVKVN
ncbi:MAG: NfeD family protein [Cellulosilyticaceae bacterium]